MLKKIILILSILFLAGCAPKIVSNKSPLVELDKTNKCFAIPLKENLLKREMHIQKLYELTAKVLASNGFDVMFGYSENCKNFIFTDWSVTSSEYQVTQKGTTYTNSYGNAYTNPYSNSANANVQTYSYTTPDYTYTAVDYYGSYYLSVSVYLEDKLVDVWEGSQSGRASGVTKSEAERVSDEDYNTVKKMVEKMLIENGLISKK